MLGEFDFGTRKLPAHMRRGAIDYLTKGLRPGSFLYKTLSNDLVGAFGRADDVNILHMREWAEWLYNSCPRDAWGSEEKVEAWIDRASRNQGLDEEND